MVRIIGILAGLFFSIAALWSLLLGGYAAATQEAHAPAAEYVYHREPVDLDLPSDGVFGSWDLQQLQRGYQVYKEVCSACHSLSLVAFRDLAQLGYSEAEIKAEATTWSVPGVDPATGEAILRPAVATDYFPKPYPNDVAAAAANNNAIPPDLSLITKAREGGADYVHSLLIGYQAQPAELVQQYPAAATQPGLYYNPYFPYLNIAMPPPFTAAGQVTYADGTEQTIEQMSEDVTSFLVWAAEPTLPKRHQTGWPVIGFLIFATVLAFLAKKQIWAKAVPAARKEEFES